ncbi:hypothetical protein ABK040_008564 [Willaertia magna]
MVMNYVFVLNVFILWKWRRENIHWKNYLDYNLDDVGICEAHAFNRLLICVLELTFKQDINAVEFFINLFGKHSSLDILKNKKQCINTINDTVISNEIKKRKWPLEGIKIKLNLNNHEDNNENNSKIEFNQLLFKMADKIILSYDIWKNKIKEYYLQHELNNHSNIRNLITIMSNQLNIVEERLIFNENIEKLWKSLQNVWLILKADKNKWMNWKNLNYMYPQETLNSFFDNIWKICKSSKGLADYIHIVVEHTIEIFENTGKPFSEYHNLDTESIHYSQGRRNKQTSMNGGCGYDEFLDLFIRELKIFLCKDNFDNLNNIYEQYKNFRNDDSDETDDDTSDSSDGEFYNPTQDHQL